MSFPPDDSTRYITKEILLKITFVSSIYDIRVAIAQHGSVCTLTLENIVQGTSGGNDSVFAYVDSPIWKLSTFALLCASVANLT